MEFKRKSAPESTAVATATTTKKNAGSKESSSVWINFTVLLETKKGIRKLSTGVAADNLFKKIFGDEFKVSLEALNEEQINNIISKISFDGISINVVSPSEPAKFEDLF